MGTMLFLPGTLQSSNVSGTRSVAREASQGSAKRAVIIKASHAPNACQATGLTATVHAPLAVLATVCVLRALVLRLSLPPLQYIS